MNCIETSGNKIEIGTNVTLDLDVSDAMALVEEDGYDVNGFAARIGIKNSLRKLRDSNGNQLYAEGVNGKELYSLPIEFSRNGAWDKTKAEIGNILVYNNKEYKIKSVISSDSHTTLLVSGKRIVKSLEKETLHLERSLTKRNLCLTSDFNSEI